MTNEVYKYSIILGRSLLVALAAMPALAQKLTLNGYAKTFAAIVQEPSAAGLPGGLRTWMLYGDYRLKAAWNPSDAFSLNLAYSVSPKVANPIATGAGTSGLSARYYRIADARSKLYPWKVSEQQHFTAYHNLDRAYLRLSVGRVDCYLGRQAIAWGSARIVSPTDVIAPYPFTELDTEERIGVDAVKAVVQLGERSMIDLGYISGKGAALDSSAAFLRIKAGVAGTDATVCLTRFRKNLMAGLDLARTFGGAGVWLEVAATRQGSNAYGSYPDVFRLSAGSDYRFSDKFYAFFEYHLSTAGEAEPASYALNYQKPGFRQGPLYLMARHYLAPCFSWQITPLFSSISTPLINLNDGSFLVSQTFEYNVTQNTYLFIGANLPFGAKQLMSGTVITPKSEFGAYPLLLFLSYGMYF